nr:ribonuclease H-like domain-containing protein [Tanacetum cinerariifolium]
RHSGRHSEGTWGNLQLALQDMGVIDSGCSRHMTGNMSYLFDFEELNEGYVAFEGNPKGGKITGKGKIKTGKLDFDDIYFLPDASHVLLRVPRENNMYNVNLKNIVPSGDLTCLFAKATLDESNLWHKRLAHGNPQHAMKDKGVINSGYPKGGKIFGKGKIRIGKLDFDDVYFVKELKFNLFSISQMCDKKNSVLFTDTECLVLSSDFKLPDDNQVLLRVPRENNMYNVDLKSIVPSGDLTCLFAKATLDEKTGEENVQQYVLFPIWSSGYTNPQNTDGDATFDEKEPEFKGRKPESEVNVSPRSSAQSKKHDDKTKREAKGKSHVKSLTGYINLSAEFKDLSDNSINEDNAVGTLVPDVRQLSTNSTNTFSADDPLNVVVSPTHGKSSCIDTSQYPNDPNMPELEDITYSDDEEDVGA